MKNNHTKDTSFKGTGWSFPPSFNRGSNTAQMVSDETDIQQSLNILLTTSVGERLMRPEYGCDLGRYLFEPINTTLETYIRDLVETAILYHEPRILLEKLSLTDQSLEGVLLIEIDYRIRRTNTRANFVFPFYKNEASELKS